MTRNEAIKCLELEDGFTSEEVKHNYARLTKSVRPEESPEEFSKLNEAYRLLSAELRRRGRNAKVSDERDETGALKGIDEDKTSPSVEIVDSKENDVSKTEDTSTANDVSKAEVTSKDNDVSKAEVTSKANDISKSEVISKVNDTSKTEVISKSDDSSSPEVTSKVAADGTSEISNTIDDINDPKITSKLEKDITPEVLSKIGEDTSAKGITNIKDNPEWKNRFIQMFAKEDIDRKRLAAIEEELVNVLHLHLLERKTGLKQFFRYGNSSVLKSPEFKAFLAEKLINIWLDPEETNLIINYYRLKKSSNSTEDILLLARLNKNKKKLTLTKIVKMLVISFIIAASATMIIHGGLPKDLSAYVIGVITMLIIFFMLLKTRFPI